jgi:pyruvate ferredoxin oxidoreductase gamma subunit
LVAQAVISEGKFAQAFPSFGPERRGAPVLAFVRIDSKEPIRIRAEITEPDVVVVLDPGLLTIVNVADGLKDDGIVIINTKKPFAEVEKMLSTKSKLAKVDATGIARETLGVPITNTTMVGALLKATEVVKLESVVEPLHKRFGRLAERNVNAMKRAYQETEIRE